MDWIFKEDDYIPDKGTSPHIEKSILSVLGILARMRREISEKTGFYSISPAVKFFFTLLTVILLAITRNYVFLFAVDSLALLCISFLKLKDIKGILAISSTVTFFSLVILIPSALMGNHRNSFVIIMKIWGSVSLVNILAFSTSVTDITRTMRIYFIPGLIILIIELALKYIVILGNFSLNMLLSLKLRNIGNDGKKHIAVSNLAGTLFLKSGEMSEETYHAMQCRCFDGEYKAGNTLKFSLTDVLYSCAGITLAISFFIL
jgi:cobalt/nickel transport system permease protein